MAGFVWLMLDNDIVGSDVRVIACILTIFAGVSMVTNCRFYSFKDINLRKSVPFIFVGAIVLAFALVFMYPPGVLFGLFVVYALSGYALSGLRLLRRKPASTPL